MDERVFFGGGLGFLGNPCGSAGLGWVCLPSPEHSLLHLSLPRIPPGTHNVTDAFREGIAAPFSFFPLEMKGLLIALCWEANMERDAAGGVEGFPVPPVCGGI